MSDLGDRRTSFIIDDVASDREATDGTRRHHTPLTSKDYALEVTEKQDRPESELAGFSISVLNRLIALEKHPLRPSRALRKPPMMPTNERRAAGEVPSE